MNTALPQPAPTLADSLDAIMARLCQATAEQCGVNRFIAPICMVLWGHLLRVSARFQILFVRWREGRLPPAGPSASRPCNSRKRPRRAAVLGQPKPALPRAFSWLLKHVPLASVYGSQLQHLLTNPEMAAFLADAPQAGRLLLPLCRTLGVKPIPEMLRPRNPKPGTPAPEGPSYEKPPCEPRPNLAEKCDPRTSLSLPGDPPWERPVPIWSRPPRPRN
jgi:hypothetical protein